MKLIFALYEKYEIDLKELTADQKLIQSYYESYGQLQKYNLADLIRKKVSLERIFKQSEKNKVFNEKLNYLNQKIEIQNSRVNSDFECLEVLEREKNKWRENLMKI